MTNFRIIQQGKVWLSISAILFVILVLALGIWGFRYGIDFTGGSLMEVNFPQDRPTVQGIEQSLAELDLKSLTVQMVGDQAAILRFQDTSEETHQAVIGKLKDLTKDMGGIKEQRFNAVGPSIGQELKQKAVYAIALVLLAILLYITYAFRKVAKPIASWEYGAAALIAMLHDAIITIGIFAVLGKFYGIEINTPFVAAVLTVLGYSVHDTIVVFDRIRENLPKSDEDFETTVNISLNQTLIRSLNTSLTVILVLVAIIIFGGEAIRTFALALLVGIVTGTYSSIFVASPLLVLWEKMRRK